jgi:hypothetical protein
MNNRRYEGRSSAHFAVLPLTVSNGAQALLPRFLAARVNLPASCSRALVNSLTRSLTCPASPSALGRLAPNPAASNVLQRGGTQLHPSPAFTSTLFLHRAIIQQLTWRWKPPNRQMGRASSGKPQPPRQRRCHAPTASACSPGSSICRGTSGNSSPPPVHLPSTN